MTTLVSSGITNGESRNYFGKMKQVLKILGLPLTDDNSTAYKIYSFFIYSTIVVGYILLYVKQMFKMRSDGDSRTLFFFPLMICGITSCLAWIRRIELGKLLEKMEQAPFSLNIDRGGQIEEKLMEKCGWIIKAQAYFYWINGCVCVIGVFVIVIIIRIRSNDYHDWQFPVGTFDPLNVTYSPNYEICLGFQAAAAIFLPAHFVTVDLIIAGALAHISFQFRLLQNNLKEIIHISYKNMIKDNQCEDSAAVANGNNYQTIPWKYLKKSLSEAVSYHVAIIGIAEEVESLFKGLFLIAYLMTMGIICFAMYKASRVSVLDSDLFGVVGQVVTSCGQILMLCYWGEQVSFQSQEVGRAAYEADFAGTDPKFQKSLALIILRSQKPTNFTTYNFAVVGLPTWLWILRTAYSAFMMLRNLQVY